MKTNKTMVAASVIIGAALLGGCASRSLQSTPSQSYPAATSSTSSTSSSYGVVDSIQPVGSNSSGGMGVGAVVGGVAGGVLGHQVGSGRGNTAATVAGAVGGAMVGNEVEQRNKTSSGAYQVGIRLDNGSYQTVTQDTVADLSVGNRVRIENGRVYRY
jgi:outer membrane lipoprotein SlyB